MADVQGEPGAQAGSRPAPDNQQLITQIKSEKSQSNQTDQRDDFRDPASGDVNIHTFAADRQAVQAAATAATGAGFQFTPEQIETQIEQCAKLRQDYVKAKAQAQSAAATASPPAPDEAGSRLQASQAQLSLRNLTDVIQSQITFLAQWQATLTTVKANYLEQEHLTESQWQRLAKGLPA